MENGGYVMIDGAGIDLETETKQTNATIFPEIAKCEKLGKPVLFYGFEVDGQPASPVYCAFYKSGTKYITIFAAYSVEIEADGVTVKKN